MSQTFGEYLNESTSGDALILTKLHDEIDKLYKEAIKNQKALKDAKQKSTVKTVLNSLRDVLSDISQAKGGKGNTIGGGGGFHGK